MDANDGGDIAQETLFQHGFSVDEVNIDEIAEETEARDVKG